MKPHTPGNNPKDYTQHSEHRESLKSKTYANYQYFPVTRWLLESKLLAGEEGG
jgi:hypothetical protein